MLVKAPDLFAAFLDLALSFLVFDPFFFGAGGGFGGDASFFLFQCLFDQGLHFADHLSFVAQLAAMDLGTDLEEPF